ncbi:1152_t:CDS:2 [Funneliformis caledonium]|uniref:1152_t:CDS:1 n=1 Tax=Funneliformis caledonium TaxID=1117310 RepID=A0A9N9FQT6_9GLOM|nr:1152_t:CDS:2 [Funneliformis caledonium]
MNKNWARTLQTTTFMAGISNAINTCGTVRIAFIGIPVKAIRHLQEVGPHEAEVLKTKKNKRPKIKRI